MPEMNQSSVNFGSSTFNPFTAMTNRAKGGGMGSAMIQHGLYKDAMTHEYGLKSGLSTQEHQQRTKEQAAGNRHEIRKIALEHKNNLEVKAVDHTNSVSHMREESGLRMGEENARANNALEHLNTGHRNATEWLQQLHKAAAPGTEVSLSHGDAKASFTTKAAKAKGATTPTQTGPSFVGMPGYHVTTPAPVTEPEGPKPTVKRGPNGRMVSLKEGVQTAIKQKPAPKKTGPLVAKGPKGRFAKLPNKG